MENIFTNLGLDMDHEETVERVKDACYSWSLMQGLMLAGAQRGMTRADIARRMGVGVSVIRALETPGANVRLSMVRRYAMAVGAVIAHQLEISPIDSEGSDSDD